MMICRLMQAALVILYMSYYCCVQTEELSIIYTNIYIVLVGHHRMSYIPLWLPSPLSSYDLQMLSIIASTETYLIYPNDNVICECMTQVHLRTDPSLCLFLVQKKRNVALFSCCLLSGNQRFNAQPVNTGCWPKNLMPPLF